MVRRKNAACTKRVSSSRATPSVLVFLTATALAVTNWSCNPGCHQIWVPHTYDAVVPTGPNTATGSTFTFYGVVAVLDDSGHVISGSTSYLDFVPDMTNGTSITFVPVGLADALAQLGIDLRNTQGNVLPIGKVFPLQFSGGGGPWYGATATGQAVVVTSTAVPPALFSLQFTITVQPTQGLAEQLTPYQDFGDMHQSGYWGTSGDCS